MSRHTASMLTVSLSQLNEQIPDYCRVDEKYDDARDRHALRDLVDLEWDQRAGDDDREVLGPPLLQPETDTFGEQQRRIKERTDAQLFEFAIVHHPELGDQSVDESIIGIDSDRGYPIGCELRHVFVKQFNRAYADGDEQQTLSKLEYRDYPEALAVGLGTRLLLFLWHLGFSTTPLHSAECVESTLAKVG